MWGYTRVSNAHLRALTATVGRANAEAAQASLTLARVRILAAQSKTKGYQTVMLEDLENALREDPRP
jgi:hypothetical protein